MNPLSFDIKDTESFFKKLLEEYKEFKKDVLSSRIALNCAMTSWHLIEWVYIEFHSILSPTYPTLTLFTLAIKAQCPSLQIMHDLSNGTKHHTLKNHRPIIKDTKLHEGTFDQSFDRSFDTSSLDIELNDGTQLYFEDEIQKMVAFWTHYLRVNFNIQDN